MGALIRMGALIEIGALINKNTFEGVHLFGSWGVLNQIMTVIKSM